MRNITIALYILCVAVVIYGFTGGYRDPDEDAPTGSVSSCTQPRTALPTSPVEKEFYCFDGAYVRPSDDTDVDDAQGDSDWIFYYRNGDYLPYFDCDAGQRLSSNVMTIDSDAFVDGAIQARGKFFTSTGNINLSVDTHPGGTLIISGAGDVGMWDCPATPNYTALRIITDTTSQVYAIMNGDTTNDKFKLKSGTVLDADDKAQLPTTGNQQFVFECLTAHTWWITVEDAAVTDGGPRVP